MEQTHLLRATVRVQKIRLAVRFACSVSVAIKSQSSTVKAKDSYPLINGEAQLHDTLKVEVEVPFRANAYKDKRITLALSITSTNGTISAGSVPISLSSCGIGQTAELNQAISKCPDRDARVAYSLTTEFIKAIRKQPQLREGPQHSEYFQGHYNKELRNSAVHGNRNYLRYSSIGGRPKSPRSLCDRKHSQERTEVRRFRSKSPPHDEGQLHRLQDHLRSEREKNWQLQKRQKVLQRENRKLEDALSLQHERESQYQLLKEECEVLSDKHGKVVSDLEEEIRSLNGEMGDLQAKLQSSERRTAVKQQTLEEQYATLLKKYQEGEEEKRQLMSQASKKTEEMELREKKHRFILKEREAAANQQRLKSEAAIRELTQQQSTWERANESLKGEVEVLKEELRSQQKQLTSETAKNQELQSQGECLNDELRKEKDRRRLEGNKKDSLHEKYEKQAREKGRVIEELNLGLQNQQKQHQRQLELLELGNTRLNSDLVETRRKLKTQQEQCVQLKTALKTHQERQAQLEDELKQKSSKVAQLENTIEALNSAESIMQKEHREQVEAHRKEKTRSEEQARNSMQRIQKLEENREEIEGQLETTAQQNRLMSNKILALEEERYAWEQAERKSEVERKLLQNQIASVIKSNRSLEELLGNKNDEILKGTFEAAKVKELHHLQKQLLSCKEANAKLASDQHVRGMEMEHLAQANHALTLANKSLKLIIEGMGGRVPDTAEGQSALKLQCERYRLELVELQREMKLQKEFRTREHTERNRSVEETRAPKAATHQNEQNEQNEELEAKARKLQILLEECEFEMECQREQLRRMASEKEWVSKENGWLVKEVESLSKVGNRGSIARALEELSGGIKRARRMVSTRQQETHSLMK